MRWMGRGAGSLLLGICAAAVSVPARASNDALFVAQSVPTAMGTGELAQVWVRMRNTGTTPWSEATLHRLGPFDDVQTWGEARAELPPGLTVAPGEEWSFSFTAVAPATPGTYAFQWQMVQDMVGWFGAITPAVDVTVALAPPLYRAPDGVDFPWQRQVVRLRWSAVPAAASYTVAATDLTAGTTTHFSGVTQLFRNVPVLSGHDYDWSVAAVDAEGNASAAAHAAFSVRANVPDLTPPTLALSRPQGGAVASGGLLVAALAADDVGVDRVELLAAGQPSPLVLRQPPYLFHWISTAVADGPRQLTVTAFDAAGNPTSTAVTVVVDNSEPDCLPPAGGPGGDEAAINAALVGAGAVARLCPGAVYHLQGPIVFTAPDQDLHTQGFATGSSRARLIVEGGATGGAIDGLNVSGVRIRNLRIDGNRDGAPAIVGGQALIYLGGDAQDQLVSHVRAHDPRSWSVLHFFQGNPDPAVGCARALAISNIFGPAGHPGPLGSGQWADGISLCCRDSRVVKNRITDVTDGGIVVFASPGSRIAENEIVAATRTMLGGINMVDFDAFHGDYRGTVVARNTISATGAPIKIALAMGWPAMNCIPDDSHRNVGGAVIDNTLTGDLMHYGFVANGVWDWTVRGNQSLAIHSGIPDSVCTPLPFPSPPAAFLAHPTHADGFLQPEFVDGQVDALLGVHD